MSLDFVPDDMIALVFSKLDVRSLHRMRAVNKRMYAIKPIVKNNLEEIRLEVSALLITCPKMRNRLNMNIFLG